jgi:hypothetical protein
MNTDSSVCTVISYRLDFSLCHHTQIVSGAHPTSHPMDIEGYSRGDNASEAYS